MYWWARAAQAVATGRTIRVGLITTKSITQSRNRAVVSAAAEHGARVMWAIANHPWVEGVDGAVVRVAMTAVAREPASATLVRVNDRAEVVGQVTAPRLNADLSAHADVAGAAKVPLRANQGISPGGFYLRGKGFILAPDEAQRLLATDPAHREIIRPYMIGRDLTARPRVAFVIDFGSMSCSWSSAVSKVRISSTMCSAKTCAGIAGRMASSAWAAAWASYAG